MQENSYHNKYTKDGVKRMLLKSFRVTEFRSVEDSGWIDAEQVTALIGTNESGKTNILLPLWKLNPVEDGAIDLKDDLPRDKFHIYRDSSDKPIFIRAKYELSDDEKRNFLYLLKRNLMKYAK